MVFQTKLWQMPVLPFMYKENMQLQTPFGFGGVSDGQLGDVPSLGAPRGRGGRGAGETPRRGKPRFATHVLSSETRTFVLLPSPFFPGIRIFLENLRMVEKNGESAPLERSSLFFAILVAKKKLELCCFDFLLGK